MSSDGSFENFSNIEVDSGDNSGEKQEVSNQMILEELSAIRQILENKPASDLLETHMALITKFTNLTIEHEKTAKQLSVALLEIQGLKAQTGRSATDDQESTRQEGVDTFRQLTRMTAKRPANPHIVEINKRLKAAETLGEREAVLADLKKNPIMFHAWMRQAKAE